MQILYKGNSLNSVPNYADLVQYDNTASGMAATNVQGAVDELNASLIDIASLHLVGTQRGTGSTNVTVITESSKRLLAITKKSGVIVETKEIPTSVLESGDKIVLGEKAPIIGTDNVGTNTPQTNLIDKELCFKRGINPGSTTGISVSDLISTDGLWLYENCYIGLAADLSKSTGAKLTFNGSNSFTITVTDSTLSVYLYTDMLVLGGSASGRNVSFDASGTDLSSTDVEGAIKELNADLTAMLNKLNWSIVWTNTSPTSNFNPQDIEIDLNDVREICVLVASSTSGGNSVSNVVPINVDTYNLITTAERYRSMTIDTVNNKLTFGAGYSGSSAANNCAIPRYILTR